MSNLTSYSALTTKIHAMQSQLLTDDNYRELASCPSIPEALAYLKKRPFYRQLFGDADESTLHREQIEQLLSQAIFFDFQKIYHFANNKQRRSILLLFEKYTPALIRHCLYNIISGPTLMQRAVFTHPFFKAHAGVGVDTLLACDSVESLVTALEGTGYDLPVKAVHESPSPTLFQYELALDMHYYASIWKRRSKYADGKDLEFIEHTLGSSLDLLNVQWIYRCKKYFHMPAISISSMLIPVHYKLKKETLRALVETVTLDDFFAIMDKTCYGKMYRAYMPSQESPQTPNLQHADEVMYTQSLILDRIYYKDRRGHPYSIASVNAYIHCKQTEIARIVTVMEGIRYSLTTNEILTNIHLRTAQV